MYRGMIVGLRAHDCTDYRRRWFVATSLVLACGFMLAAFQGDVYAQAATAENDEAVPPDPPAVAVVPFTNISGDPSDDWIGSGIAETVTADLERLGSVAVVGREAFLDPGRQPPADLASGGESEARELGRLLGVSWIVTGGFQRVGDQLRITARIVQIETGAVSETAKVDGKLDELFALQDRIVAELGPGFELLASEPAPRVAAAEPRRDDSRGRAGFLPTSQGDAPSGEGEFSEAGASSPSGTGGFGARTPEATADRGTPSAEVPASAGPTGSPGGLGAPAGRVAPASPPSRATVPAPSGLPPEDVTGSITFESNEPRLGLATEAGVLTGRPTVRPPRSQTRPAIDGRLDDAIWRTAARITEFVQQNPVEGAPATEDTDVYVAYDSQNIYFAVHAHYSDPSIMRANRSDRDQAFRDDTVSVYFDTFLDQQRAYVFSVNGYGVQMDSIMNSRGSSGGGFSRGGGGRSRGGSSRSRGGGGFSGGGGSSGIPRGDSSWDALYDSGGQIVEDGFTAEMAIPFKSLRYPQRDGATPHRWGFQIAREIRGKDENVVWSPLSRDIAGFLPQMGVLDGMSNLSTSRNLEILPTFTAINFGSLDTDTGNFNVKDTSPEGGVNFKYGVTSNLTADFTLNPDFSQIESDRPQIEVNQRFALFYPELRPFFLEGAEIFDMRGPVTIVHTRTIVDPKYGAKLTGKVGKTTVGVMFANDEAPGNVADPADPAFDQTAQTFVGRVRYDLYSESFIGGVVTDREFVDGYSRLGGVDGSFRLGRTHTLSFRAIGTQHRDLDGIERTGEWFHGTFRKEGRNLSYSFYGYALSPDFKTDVGFVRRTDQKRITGNVSYRWWPESWIINWGPSVRYGRSYNFDDILEDEEASVSFGASFARNISFNGSINRDMERFGGIDFQKSRISYGGGVNTSRKVSFGGFFNRGDEVFYDAVDPYLGYNTGGALFITVRPVSRFQSQININTSRFTDPRSNDEQVFDVKILRGLTTYQFTERLLFRNITEYNTFDKTVGLNFLGTYRVNAGTVFYIGYDDHYQRADRLFDEDRDINGDGIPDPFYQPNEYKQTNRAIFMKFQYLFRY